MNPTIEQLETKLSSALHGLNSSQTQLRLTDDPSAGPSSRSSSTC